MSVRFRYFGPKRAAMAALVITAAAGSLFHCAATRAAESAPAPARRSVQELAAELAADQTVVNGLLGTNNAALKTPELRSAAAPKLVPPLRRMVADLDELTAAMPAAAPQTSVSIVQLLSMSSVLGDDAASARIESFAKGGTPDQAVTQDACRWLAKWYTAAETAAAQTQVVTDLETLDVGHPDSEFLARLTAAVSKEAGSPEQADRMLQIVADRMNSPAATLVRHGVAAKKEAVQQDALLANKPLTLNGLLPGGQTFSTESLKGKVVLVDFWAVWCVPCRAELPRVKKLYDAYHGKGLEVVGVSNDYDVDTLKAFTAREGLPWPQLFDPKAAANREMNPITLAQKIDGIPVMYLIDRKGILRTVNARMNAEDLIPKLLAEPG